MISFVYFVKYRVCFVLLLALCCADCVFLRKTQSAREMQLCYGIRKRQWDNVQYGFMEKQYDNVLILLCFPRFYEIKYDGGDDEALRYPLFVFSKLFPIVNIMKKKTICHYIISRNPVHRCKVHRHL